MVDARSGELQLDKSLEDVVGGEGEVTHVALSPSGSLVALAAETEDEDGDSKYEVLLVDSRSGAVVHRVDSGGSDPLQMAFSHSSEVLAFGTTDGVLRLSCVQPARESHPSDEKLRSNDWIRCVSWSSTDQSVACGDDDGRVKVRGTTHRDHP